MFSPLAGVRVVDCCTAGAGPSCTKLLCEYGADVIWIEPPQGSNTRDVHKFDFYTAGKRSIAVDLKTEAGQQIIHRFLSKADIFVSNYRPAARQRLGLDYEALHTRYPALIYADITGFGQTGPEVNAPGYDPVAFWSKSGLLMDIAERGSLVVPPVAVGDIAAGLAMAGGIMAALYNRTRTGEGCHAFTSLYGVGAYLNHDAAIEVQYGETYPKSRKSPRRSLLNTYCCKDGKWITITIVDGFEKRFWPLLEKVGRGDLVHDPRWRSISDTTYDKAPEVVSILDEAFAAMTQDEAVTALSGIDVPVSRVNSTVDMLCDPQAQANHYFYHRKATLPPSPDQPEILVPCVPVKFNELESGTTNHERGPGLGEHSLCLLQEYGYSVEEIGALERDGVVIAGGRRAAM